MNQLFRLAYVSSASKPFSRAEMRTMLKDAGERNAEARVTGLWLQKEGRFMQILEGPKAAVASTFRRITRDPRHFGVIVLIKETAKERHFNGQAMAYRNLDLPKQRDVPGYREFLDIPLTGKEFASQPSRCEKLLLLFKPEPARK